MTILWSQLKKQHYSAEVICVNRAIWLRTPPFPDSLSIPMWIHLCLSHKLMSRYCLNGGEIKAGLVWWHHLCDEKVKYSVPIWFIMFVLNSHQLIIGVKCNISVLISGKSYRNLRVIILQLEMHKYIRLHQPVYNIYHSTEGFMPIWVMIIFWRWNLFISFAKYFTELYYSHFL